MADILGIKISELKRQEAEKSILDFLNSDKSCFLTTPNPEIILAARKDPAFAKTINSADLSLADGTGLKLAAHLNGYKLERFTGADLSLWLLEIAEKNSWPLAIIISDTGLSSKSDLEQALKKYTRLNFLIIVANTDNQEELKKAVSLLSDYSPKIVFCTFGAPQQEIFIKNNLINWPSVRLAAGVGGAFDFISGRIKRAPKWMRFIGIEWLWRLLKQPRRRFKRIFRAVIVFPALIIKDRISKIFK
jgi:N-acetylglucosaminyldiphosphoundecaprenol N-acetyl-beta-D-mannosaminyltransferase